MSPAVRCKCSRWRQSLSKGPEAGSCLVYLKPLLLIPESSLTSISLNWCALAARCHATYFTEINSFNCPNSTLR